MANYRSFFHSQCPSPVDSGPTQDACTQQTEPNTQTAETQRHAGQSSAMAATGEYGYSHADITTSSSTLDQGKQTSLFTVLTPQATGVRETSANKGNITYNVKTLYMGCSFTDNDANSVVAAVSWQTEEEGKRLKTENIELQKLLSEQNIILLKQSTALSEQSTTLLEQARQIENMRQQNERLQASAQQVSREQQEEQIRRYTELLHQRAEVERESALLQERLREETRLGEKRLDALKARHEEERQKEREQVKTFILAVESRLNRIVSSFDELQVTRVAERLYQKFNVRLLAATCGLTFVMETTADQWARLVEHQVEIQEELLGLIPEGHHEDVSWQQVTEYETDTIDLRLGNPLPPSVSSDVTPLQAEQDTDQTGQVTFDPLSSTLELRSTIKPYVKGKWWRLRTSGDRKRPWIRAMVTHSAAVFMADWNNDKIKVFSLLTPHQLQHCLRVDRGPLGLAMVTGRQLLAVTVEVEKKILLIDVTATPVVCRSIPTGRFYWGVVSHEDGMLVVSSPRHELLPASVDVITLEGVVVRTVISSDEVRRLFSPRYLCVSGRTVFLSDYDINCVYQADLVTGQLTTLPLHPDLDSPCQVNVDHAGHLYVASEFGECVLVRTAAGEWRQLLNGQQHGERGLVYAECVCVTDTGLLLVGWSDGDGDDTVVKIYQFT